MVNEAENVSSRTKKTTERYVSLLTNYAINNVLSVTETYISGDKV